MESTRGERSTLRGNKSVERSAAFYRSTFSAIRINVASTCAGVQTPWSSKLARWCEETRNAARYSIDRTSLMSRTLYQPMHWADPAHDGSEDLLGFIVEFCGGLLRGSASASASGTVSMSLNVGGCRRRLRAAGRNASRSVWSIGMACSLPMPNRQDIGFRALVRQFHQYVLIDFQRYLENHFESLGY